MSQAPNSIQISDTPTLELVGAIMQREGEPITTAVVRRAIRAYANANHPDLVQRAQLPPAPTPVAPAQNPAA